MYEIGDFMGDGKKNARFGSRYGSKIRKRVLFVEAKYKGKKQECPFCGEIKAKRESAGIFKCSNCSKTFAGGAYEPSTLARRILNKLYDKKGNSTKKIVDLDDIEELEEEISEEVNKDDKKKEKKEKKEKKVKKAVEEKEEDKKETADEK